MTAADSELNRLLYQNPPVSQSYSTPTVFLMIVMMIKILHMHDAGSIYKQVEYYSNFL